MTENKYTLEELQKLGVIGQKHDTNPVNGLGVRVPHGLEENLGAQAGLFSTPGADRDVFSAMSQSYRMGNLLLAPRASQIWNPVYDIITGVRAARTDNKADDTSACTPGAMAGLMKICELTSKYGFIRIDTDTKDVTSLGGMVNEADVSRRFINLVSEFDRLVPDIVRSGDVNDFTAMQMYTTATQLARDIEETLWQGNVALTGTNAQGAFKQEFNGFDRLITNTYRDAFTTQACDSVDSLVEDWGSNMLNGTVTRNGATYNIVQVLVEMYRYLQSVADDTNMNPVQWVIAMPRDLFHALTNEWACQYLTSSCYTAQSDSNPLNMNASETRRMRDEMYSQKYLWMDGDQVPVVTSEGIAKEQTANGFESTIYFIPLRARGLNVTYLDYFNMGNGEARNWANAAMNTYRVLNGGLYGWTWSQTQFCYQQHLASRMRLIMRTPYLAARLDNVGYRNYIFTRDPYPGGVYHVDGGKDQTFATTLVDLP